MCWNFAENTDRLATTAAAGRNALIHGSTIISYRQLKQRTDAIASYLDNLLLPAGSHVGHMMRNSNSYIEAFLASTKAGMRHVNINYRYQAEELIDLLTRLDIRVLIYDQEFAAAVAVIRDFIPDTQAFIEVCDLRTAHNDFATPFHELYQTPVKPLRTCSSDDVFLVATGGTTGMPKGVLWRHEDLWRATQVSIGYDLAPLKLQQHPCNLDEHIENINAVARHSIFMPLSPLMHGAGLMATLMTLAQGGTIVTLAGSNFDASAALQAISDYKVTQLAVVGDAFARPLIAALQANPGRDYLHSLAVIVSTGASLSTDCKTALTQCKPDLIIIDTLGSSEAAGFAISSPRAGVFYPATNTRVLNDQFEELQPGDPGIGILAKGGHIPLGYYNEPEKSAETFVTVNGQRYVMTGDRCRYLADGTIELLGRDNTCINTGGEKVYTVEVERVLMSHPDIDDALVLGLPHERFGNMVVAAIVLNKATSTNVPTELKSHCQQQLADYKVPKHFIQLEEIYRAPNGKPLYDQVRDAVATSVAGGD